MYHAAMFIIKYRDHLYKIVFFSYFKL